MQLRYGLLAELVAAPGEGDALAVFPASARAGRGRGDVRGSRSRSPGMARLAAPGSDI
jgi:hypothetical protein